MERQKYKLEWISYSLWINLWSILFSSILSFSQCSAIRFLKLPKLILKNDLKRFGVDSEIQRNGTNSRNGSNPLYDFYRMSHYCWKPHYLQKALMVWKQLDATLIETHLWCGGPLAHEVRSVVSSSGPTGHCSCWRTSQSEGHPLLPTTATSNVSCPANCRQQRTFSQNLWHQTLPCSHCIGSFHLNLRISTIQLFLRSDILLHFISRSVSSSYFVASFKTAHYPHNKYLTWRTFLTAKLVSKRS